MFSGTGVRTATYLLFRGGPDSSPAILQGAFSCTLAGHLGSSAAASPPPHQEIDAPELLGQEGQPITVTLIKLAPQPTPPSLGSIHPRFYLHG